MTCTIWCARNAGSFVSPALAAPWPRGCCVTFACRHRLNARRSTRVQQCRLDHRSSANIITCNLRRFGTAVGYISKKKATLHEVFGCTGFSSWMLWARKKTCHKGHSGRVHASTVAKHGGIFCPMPRTCVRSFFGLKTRSKV